MKTKTIINNIRKKINTFYLNDNQYVSAETNIDEILKTLKYFEDLIYNSTRIPKSAL